MANFTVTAMDMAMDTVMDMAILKMNKEKSGGNFGNWLQAVVCTVQWMNLCNKFNLSASKCPWQKTFKL